MSPLWTWYGSEMGPSTRSPRLTWLGLSLVLAAQSGAGEARGQAGYAAPNSVTETGEVRPEPAPPTDQSAATRGRDEPKLVQRNADGTYAYKGQGFDAVIAPDGSVRMTDVFVRSGVRLSPRRANNGEWFVSFWEIRRDLQAWLEKKFGSDVHRSERRRFLEGTRDLREKLAIAHTLRTTRSRVNELWSKPGLSFVERRRRTFQMWDDSTEDAYGQVGRRAVEEFVRDECPEGSGRGYSPEELEHLNQQRKSQAPFAPYAPPR